MKFINISIQSLKKSKSLLLCHQHRRLRGKHQVLTHDTLRSTLQADLGLTLSNQFCYIPSSCEKIIVLPSS